MSKLCDHAKICLGLKGIQHLDDILMPQPAQDLDLLPQVPDVLLALPMLHDEFHGCDLACELPAPLVYLHVGNWMISTYASFRVLHTDVLMFRG